MKNPLLPFDPPLTEKRRGLPDVLPAQQERHHGVSGPQGVRERVVGTDTVPRLSPRLIASLREMDRVIRDAEDLGLLVVTAHGK